MITMTTSKLATKKQALILKVFIHLGVPEAGDSTWKEVVMR
jgi:hypothetical protein